MAFSSGFESYLDNIGEMRNSGWEITLNGMLIKRPDMRWDVTIMASTQSNKVLKLTPETPEIIDGLDDYPRGAADLYLLHVQIRGRRSCDRCGALLRL